MSDAVSDADAKQLIEELQGLRGAISLMKTEIAAMKHASAEEDRIVAATQELDAIVGATEQATEGILNLAEEIDEAVGDLKGGLTDPDSIAKADRISQLATGLFEACNFQDITGQRVTKVVSTLKYVEERVSSMISIIGEDAMADVEVTDTREGDSRLLNGPQQQDKGVSQADIDALFD